MIVAVSRLDSIQTTSMMWQIVQIGRLMEQKTDYSKDYGKNGTDKKEYNPARDTRPIKAEDSRVATPVSSAGSVAERIKTSFQAAHDALASIPVTLVAGGSRDEAGTPLRQAHAQLDSAREFAMKALGQK